MVTIMNANKQTQAMHMWLVKNGANALVGQTCRASRSEVRARAQTKRVLRALALSDKKAPATENVDWGWIADKMIDNFTNATLPIPLPRRRQRRGATLTPKRLARI